MKILVVRFSSIGDIVLTSAVINRISETDPSIEIHYLTKYKFKDLVSNDDRISKVYTIESSLNEIVQELKKERYDHILDLHNNLRTWTLKFKLRRPSTAFRKLNIKKWLQVYFKRSMKGEKHVVDRYLETLKSINIQTSSGKIEFNIKADLDLTKSISFAEGTYYTIAIGAQFETKQIPTESIVFLIESIKKPVVLVGGPMDEDRANHIKVLSNFENIQSVCGKFSLNESAFLIKKSVVLITGDTGLMHIASAFDLPIISIWGNTIPEFGMYPYRPGNENTYSIHQVNNLSCRPCSKIGYHSCPKKHFRCMHEINYEAVAKEAISYF